MPERPRRSRAGYGAKRPKWNEPQAPAEPHEKVQSLDYRLITIGGKTYRVWSADRLLSRDETYSRRNRERRRSDRA